MGILDNDNNFTAINDGTNWNKHGTLATNAVNVLLTKPGVWKVHADTDYGFYVRGPHSNTNDATTNSQWWAKDDEVLYEVKRSNMQISLLNAGPTSGTYHLSWLSGL